MRPNSAAMSAAESLRLPGRSRVPLAVLLVVDVGLAVAGGLLLRAGLAKPAEASEEIAPASATPTSAAPTIETTPPAGAERSAQANAEPSAQAKAAPGAPASEAPSANAAPADGAASTDEKKSAGAPSAAGDPRSAPPSPPSSEPEPARKNAKPAKTGKRESTIDPYPQLSEAELNQRIDAVVLKHRAALDHCYSSVAKLTAPTSITIGFRLVADGSLSDATVVALGAPLSEVLAMCVKAQMARWKVTSVGASEQTFFRTIKFGKRS